jgi:predicted enzyme related to lactoylglutathione lyase
MGSASSCSSIRPRSPGSRPPIEAHATRGYNHFALRSADIDGLWERALEAGASAVMPPADSPEPGVRFAFLADPEGNLVELVG